MSDEHRTAYRPTADEIEAAWAVMRDGAEMNGGAMRLTERALIAAAEARRDFPLRTVPATDYDALCELLASVAGLACLAPEDLADYLRDHEGATDASIALLGRVRAGARSADLFPHR
jgi:hypothetical protein